ncbi:TlpA family protein disulfide reductase [Neolewinella persica]|uniref:TlpA family protein disulfide reductase n=1 Tax=Neolewinella persica TaxID=70998 RepID=UPI00035FDBCB|nr:TlpA disulfide reductase family protein [Neolewinella persica]
MLRYLPLLLCLCLCTCGPAPEPPAPLPTLGNAGRTVIYDDFSQIESLFYQQNDTTYVVNFWATWCKPCREEIPFLQRLANETADQKLRVILVSLDTEAGAIKRIPQFLSDVAPGLASIVLTDEDPAWGKSIDRVWTGNLPTTILYKKDLRFVYRRNFPTYIDLRSALDPLIGR